MGTPMESSNLQVVVQSDGTWTVVNKSQGVVILTTQVKGGRLMIRDFNGKLWLLAEALTLVFAHHEFLPDEIRALVAGVTPGNASALRAAFKAMLTDTVNLPDDQRRVAKTLLGLIEDDAGLEARRAAEAQDITHFLAPFGAAATPDLLTPSIAEIHAQYQARVARDLCGHSGNCLWWLPACSDSWRFWRQLGWSSTDKDKVRELDPEDTQAGTWVLWTPVIQSGDPDAIMIKFRQALNLRYDDSWMVRNATPSQLLYLLRRAEKMFGGLALGDDESLVTTAQTGWWKKEQVRIRRATASAIDTVALDAAAPGGDELAYRIAAVDRASKAPEETRSMDPLELLLTSKAPQGYVDGIMPICFVK